MNNTVKEKIKNLAIQARREVKRPGVFTEAEFEEKFAELIVQECATLCDLYAMPDGTSETAIILASAIRRKFGVEE